MFALLVMFIAILQLKSLDIMKSVFFKEKGERGIYNQFLYILSPNRLQNDALSYALYYFSQAALLKSHEKLVRWEISRA